MAYMDGNEAGGGLPADHWIHKALSKEKSRLAKKKAGPAAAEGGATPEKPPLPAHGAGGAVGGMKGAGVNDCYS